MYSQRNWKNALPLFSPLCLIVEYREHTCPESWTPSEGGRSSTYLSPDKLHLTLVQSENLTAGRNKIFSQTQTAQDNQGFV